MINGAVQYKPLTTPQAPPFPANAADNGLSVDPVTGHIVLGNDIGGNLADLLSDREITMQGFLFQMVNNGGRKFSIDPTSALYGIGDIDAVDGGARLTVDNLQIFGAGPVGNMMLLSKLIDQYHMGDINATLNGSELVIDDFTRLIDFRDSIGPMMQLDRGNSVWTFGDPANGNQTNLNIDDANSFTTIRDILGEMFWLDRVAGSYRIGDVAGAVNGLNLNLIDSASTATIGDNLGQMMSLDSINALYQIGAVGGQGNMSLFSMDDILQLLKLETGGLDYLTIDGIASTIQLSPGNLNAPGVFLDGPNFIGYLGSDQIGYRFLVDDSAVTAAVRDGNNNDFILIGAALTSQVQIGDISSLGDGSNFIIDIVNGDFSFNNTAGNSRLVVNGQGGFTGTVTPVNSITVEGGIVTAVS